MKCKPHKYQTVSQSVHGGRIVAEVKRCLNCGRELRARDTEFSGQTVADTPAAPTPSNVMPFALPNAAKSRTGGFSAGVDGALFGKTVELEDYVRGSIVDQTEQCVGIMLDGEGCRVVYVSKADLLPQNED